MKRFFALCLMAVAFATAPAFSDDLQDGFDAYYERDYKTVLQKLRPLAEQGVASAQYYMGVMYRNGQGVVQDYKTAVKWWRLSSEQGDSLAQYNLGVMYNNGDGVVQNYKEAMKWWKLSAEQGIADAQYGLGWMYDRGEGVLQDIVLAHMWFNIAASNDHEKAHENRDNLAKKMSHSQIEKAQGLASECVNKNYKGC